MKLDSVIQRAIIVVCLVIPVSCFSGELSLPEGWRLPMSSEVAQKWRSESPNRYLTIAADLNGDGIIDKSMLLVRKNGTGLALFAFVSQKNGTVKVYLLDEIKNNAYIEVMGVSLSQPGRYKTACGKGYFECQKDEPEEIILLSPAINYFKEESSNSFFYWDESKNNFRRIWMSD